jgi:hypothetical protein
VNNSRPTQLKRQRERAQAEKRQQKAQRRLESKDSKNDRPRGPGDEDPDIAGIKPGPQPSPYADFPGFADEEKADKNDTEA